MERTYVFNQDGNNGNGGGSKFDIMAMLPNLMGSKGVDPGLLALLNQGRGSQDQCYPCKVGRYAEPSIAGQDCGSYSRKSHFDR